MATKAPIQAILNTNLSPKCALPTNGFAFMLFIANFTKAKHLACPRNAHKSPTKALCPLIANSASVIDLFILTPKSPSTHMHGRAIC